MPHTVRDWNHPRVNKRPVQDMEEVSDTETINDEHVAQNTKVYAMETINHENTDIGESYSACHSVLGITELLEHIISFLPMKKIFSVQRVAKQWRDVIATSPSIEENMFLGFKVKPEETCEPHALGWPHNAWALQRLVRPMLTLVSLNPELRRDPVCKIRHYGLTCAGHGRRVMVQWGPSPIRKCHSLFDTYISDPPCKKAEVSLTVRFKKETRGALDSDPEYPIKIWVNNITASSESGLTFQDVLRAALNARGQTECKDDFNFLSQFADLSKDDMFRYKTFSWAPDDSLRDAISLLPKYSGIPEILDCPLMELRLTLLDDVAATTQHERALLRQVRSPKQ